MSILESSCIPIIGVHFKNPLALRRPEVTEPDFEDLDQSFRKVLGNLLGMGAPLKVNAGYHFRIWISVEVGIGVWLRLSRYVVEASQKAVVPLALLYLEPFVYRGYDYDAPKSHTQTGRSKS